MAANYLLEIILGTQYVYFSTSGDRVVNPWKDKRSFTVATLCLANHCLQTYPLSYFFPC